MLIDEPEMHLHPRWQKKFLKLIQKLITQSNTQFILVTHSAHLIEPSTLSSLARVYKNTDAHSKIVKPTNAQLSSQPEKDVFQIVNILNSEKIYFADMVVLVEGVEDRIIYEKAVQILQPESNARTIEVVEVGGKKQFDKFQKHLDIFDIPHATIADLDYVSDIGTNEVKTAFKESSQKVVKRLKANDSLDSAAFGAELENLFSNKKEPYTDDDLKALRELWDYLLSKAASLIDELDDAQKKSLNEFLKNMEKQYIFLLPCGDLESLFGKSAHFNTETALAIAQSMKTDKDIPADLKRIVQVIIK